MVSLFLVLVTLGLLQMQYEQLRNEAFFFPHLPVTEFLMSSVANAVKGIIAWLVLGALAYFVIRTDVLELIKQASSF